MAFLCRRIRSHSVGEQIRGPQWPHSNPVPLDPPVELDQEDRLVSTLVYLSASLNKDKEMDHIIDEFKSWARILSNFHFLFGRKEQYQLIPKKAG